MSEEAQKAEYVDLLQEARKIDDALAAVSSKLKTLGNAPCESPIRSGLEPDFLQIKQTGRRGNPLRDSAERGGFLDFVRRRAQSNHSLRIFLASILEVKPAAVLMAKISAPPPMITMLKVAPAPGPVVMDIDPVQSEFTV